MEKRIFYLPVLLLIISAAVQAQTVQIGTPKLDFDGKELKISYDILNADQSDQFYVWVLIQNKKGETLKLNSLTGDIGDTKAGREKIISWIPANDSVFLNEEVSVELLAEKYVKSFNKGSALLMSTIMPGLGQTKISNGKPFWLIGVASYGILAGGIILHTNSISSYDDYLVEQDPAKRDDLFAKSQQQLNISNVMFVSSAAAWVLNLVWIAATPNRYKPLKHVKVRIDQPGGPLYGTKLVSLQLTF